MGRQVIIRSKEQYWRDYILSGISKGLCHATIKEQLLEAFRKEIFGQITLRMNTDDLNKVPETLKNKKTIENIAKQSQNKWISLCIMCAGYKETKGLIMPSDIETISVEDFQREKHAD